MYCVHCGQAIPDTQTGPCPHCGKTVAGAAVSGLSKEGNVLFVPARTEFPDFCVKCNAPAEGFHKKVKLSWHPPSLAFLLLLGLLPYAIVALIMTKRATIELPLCPNHRSTWRPMAVIGMILLVLCFVSLGVYITLDSNTPRGRDAMDTPFGAAACAMVPVLGLTSIILLSFGFRRVSPKRIDERGDAWITGVCQEFLTEHVPSAPSGL